MRAHGAERADGEVGLLEDDRQNLVGAHARATGRVQVLRLVALRLRRPLRARRRRAAAAARLRAALALVPVACADPRHEPGGQDHRQRDGHRYGGPVEILRRHRQAARQDHTHLRAAGDTILKSSSLFHCWHGHEDVASGSHRGSPTCMLHPLRSHNARTALPAQPTPLLLPMPVPRERRRRPGVASLGWACTCVLVAL